MIVLKRIIKPTVDKNGNVVYHVEAVDSDGEMINTYFTEQQIEDGYADEEDKK